MVWCSVVWVVEQVVVSESLRSVHVASHVVVVVVCVVVVVGEVVVRIKSIWWLSDWVVMWWSIRVESW